CEPRAQQNGVTIVPKSCADQVIVRADAKLMLQVLLNLVSNAVKFSHEGGVVEVSLEQGSDRSLTIAVRDKGIGIPATDIERVLRPFEQVEDSRTRAHGGTGLGLPYAVKLAELHGGALWIESQVNVGTSVMVVLPRERFVALRQAAPGEAMRVAV
ncbi:MAG: sensor histidine kinase, partial [Rhizomicrobium sp.]